MAHGLRRLAGEEILQHRIQRAGMAQHRGGQAVGGGFVTRIDGGQVVERGIERTALGEDGFKKLERGAAGGVGHGVPIHPIRA